MMLKEMRCEVKKCKEFLDLYRSQESEILHDCIKVDEATNAMILNSVTL